MASKTNVTTLRRKQRLANAGKDRRAALRNKGTTPKFPIHTPEIDAAAPPAQVAPKSAK